MGFYITDFDSTFSIFRGQVNQDYGSSRKEWFKVITYSCLEEDQFDQCHQDLSNF